VWNSVVLMNLKIEIALIASSQFNLGFLLVPSLKFTDFPLLPLTEHLISVSLSRFDLQSLGRERSEACYQLDLSPVNI
jgi:hypothetical protein